MSGLESIALAVAHLEELNATMARQEVNRKDADGALQSDHSSMMKRVQPATLASPPPKSIAVNPRVVSSDNISTGAVAAAVVEAENDTNRATTLAGADSATATSEAANKDEKMTGKKSNDNSVGEAQSNNLAVVLADPHSWLRSTEHLKIPAGPEGIFDTVEYNDVLCGRGGESNHHAGNQQYRRLVKAFQPLYIASKRRFKPKIAQCIVYTVRSFGGRFLKRADPRTSAFEDVGNTKAREKTSQALREGAPELRGTMESDGPEPPEGAPISDPIRLPGLASQPPTAPKPVVEPSAAHAVAYPSNNFINQQLLQAQMGAYSPFGPLMPSFAAFHPYQRAVWMAHQNQANVGNNNNNPAAIQPLPCHPQPHTVTHIKTNIMGVPTIKTVTASSQKRTIHMVSSEETSSATSNSSGSTVPALPRGPRLKRLKQRLIQENSDDEASNSNND